MGFVGLRGLDIASHAATARCSSMRACLDPSLGVRRFYAIVAVIALRRRKRRDRPCAPRERQDRDGHALPLQARSRECGRVYNINFYGCGTRYTSAKSNGRDRAHVVQDRLRPLPELGLLTAREPEPGRSNAASTASPSRSCAASCRAVARSASARRRHHHGHVRDARGSSSRRPGLCCEGEASIARAARKNLEERLDPNHNEEPAPPSRSTASSRAHPSGSTARNWSASAPSVRDAITPSCARTSSARARAARAAPHASNGATKCGNAKSAAAASSHLGRRARRETFGSSRGRSTARARAVGRVVGRSSLRARARLRRPPPGSGAPTGTLRFRGPSSFARATSAARRAAAARTGGGTARATATGGAARRGCPTT